MAKLFFVLDNLYAFSPGLMSDEQVQWSLVTVSPLLGTVTKVCDIGPPGITSYGPRREKTCLRGFSNNTGADQPAHPRSLISAFVESIICKLATGEITIF